LGFDWYWPFRVDRFEVVSILALSDPDLVKNYDTDSVGLKREQDKCERGYTSDSELYNVNPNSGPSINASSTGDVSSQQRNDWILVDYLFGSQTEIQFKKKKTNFLKKVNKEDLDYMKSQQNLLNQYKIDLDEGLEKHNKRAFVKCCETLTFLIRDLAYINTENIESCIHCLRTFVEACVSSEHRLNKTKQSTQRQQPQNAAKANRLQAKKSAKIGSTENISNNNGNNPKADCKQKQAELDTDEDNLSTSYEAVSIQLLDLLDVLHNKASSVFAVQANTENEKLVKVLLWSKCWCPILQGIARLSCDANSEVRMHSLQYLQRALLIQDLQSLSAIEWECCFNKVRLLP
jgi:hypothetical protein